MLKNFLILKQCTIQLHNFRKNIKNTMSAALGTNGVDPKVLPFLCIFVLSVMENR